MADDEVVIDDSVIEGELVEGEQKGQSEEIEGEVVVDPEQPEDGDPAAEEPETIVVQIGDEPIAEEEEKAPQWVKDLRKKNREDQRRIRELEEKLSAREVAERPQIKAKPSLADFDYDTDKFESALDEWKDQERQRAEKEAAAQRAKQEQAEAWNKRLSTYNESKAKLKVSDYEDAEANVVDTLDVTQQGIIVQYAKSPELVVYALGKNPEKLKQLQAIKDPIEFAIAARELEAQLKVTKKNAPPAPEKVVKGTATNSSAVNNTLEKLREEAAKTGDMSKVLAYKRQQRNK